MGYMESKKLSDRVKFFSQFKGFIASAETAIRYQAAPLSGLISQAAASYPALPFLSRCAAEIRQGRDFPAAWQTGVEACGKGCGLKQEDLELLRAFGLGLGATDIEGQVAHCAFYQAAAAERYGQAKEEKGKKGKLYFMLGVLSGIAAALFCV